MQSEKEMTELTPNHIEKTPAGGIDWKAEALRTARLLADAERIIAEYKAQAIEAARQSAQSAPETHGPLPSGEVDLTVMSDCSGAGAEWQPIETVPRDGRDVLVMRDIWPGTESGRAEECNGHNTYVAAWWGSEWVCYMDQVQDPRCPIEPTHWMPLPDPPIVQTRASDPQ
jgi:hypothetical protein